MAKRSVLEEHARRRAEERDRGRDDAIDDTEYERGMSPEQVANRRARIARAQEHQQSSSRTKSKAELEKERGYIKEDALIKALEKTGEKGKEEAKRLKEKRDRMKDLEDKQRLREAKTQTKHTLHIPLVTVSEAEKTRKLQTKHHKEHMKELKEARKQAEKKGFWERGVLGKIGWVLGALWGAYKVYLKIRLAMWLYQKLKPAGFELGKGLKNVTKSIGDSLARRFPALGRAGGAARDTVRDRARDAADFARERAKKARDRLSTRNRDRLDGATNKAKKLGRGLRGAARALMPASNAPASAARGVGSAALELSGLGAGTLLRAAPALAAGGYAAYQGVSNIGKVFDGNLSGGERAMAGAHLLGSGAGGVIGGVLGGPAGAALGAAAGDAAVSGAEWLGNKLADSGIGDTIGAGIAKVLSPFSDEAKEAVESTKKAADASQNSVKTNLANRKDLDEDFLKKKAAADGKAATGLKDAVDPLSESTRSLGDKISDYTDAFAKAGGTIWGGIKDASKSVISGVSDGAAALKAGYDKGGLKGAWDAASGAATKVAGGVGKGYDQLKSASSTAGGQLAYDLNKGSADQVKLAMGFQGKNTVKGLNDSQTRALAGNTMSTESAGKLGEVNPYGYAGQYQMGADALSDNGVIDTKKLQAAKAASKASGKDWYKDGQHKAFLEDNSNWINKGGREAFLNDKQMQDDLFVKYTNKNVDAGLKSGALTGTSTPEQIAAYAKAAHLKGAGGANDLMLRGKDGKDANGTNASKYAADAKKAVVDLAAKVDDAKAKSGVTDPATIKDVKVTQPETRLAGSDKPVDTSLKPVPLQAQISQAKAPEPAIVVASAVPTKTDDTGVPLPAARAQPAPQPILASNIPVEAQSQAIQVAKATAPAPERPAPTPAATQGGNQGSSGMPTLDEMPVMISDLGLVLLNVGHI